MRLPSPRRQPLASGLPPLLAKDRRPDSRDHARSSDSTTMTTAISISVKPAGRERRCDRFRGGIGLNRHHRLGRGRRDLLCGRGSPGGLSIRSRSRSLGRSCFRRRRWKRDGLVPLPRSRADCVLHRPRARGTAACRGTPCSCRRFASRSGDDRIGQGGGRLLRRFAAPQGGPAPRAPSAYGTACRAAGPALRSTPARRTIARLVRHGSPACP